MKRYAILAFLITASYGHTQQTEYYYPAEYSYPSYEYNYPVEYSYPEYNDQNNYYYDNQSNSNAKANNSDKINKASAPNQNPSTPEGSQKTSDQSSQEEKSTQPKDANGGKDKDNKQESDKSDKSDNKEESDKKEEDKKEEAPSPAPYPSMSAGLSANPHPAIFDAGPFCKLTVTGVLSGIGFWQTNPAVDFFGHKNERGYVDISNATVILNKTEGKIQFFIQAGAYSIPALGVPYVKSHKFDRKTFGFIQQGFVKFEPNKIFDIKIGALPTLIGAESTFTFENFNIERGLLWNQENAVTKGIQLDFSKDPWTVSVSWNDGFYTDQYTSASALITYTFKNKDTLTAAAMGNYFGKVRHDSFVAPVALANSQVYNLIYTCIRGCWVFNPYIQYTIVPTVHCRTPSGSTIGAAMLAKYSFNDEISCSGRIEAINSSGRANLLYGPRSSAWSITLTPTYQKGIFFCRAEGSYVSIISGKNGFMFGHNGRKNNQTRLFVETGVIF